jgi:hypothetical protein
MLDTVLVHDPFFKYCQRLPRPRLTLSVSAMSTADGLIEILTRKGNSMSRVNTLFNPFILVAAVAASIFFASMEAQAQATFPGTCALVPSFCELRGKVLDTQQCKCVRPGTGSLPGTCALLPRFCELRGQAFDGLQCRCVGPVTGPLPGTLPGACGLAPFFCEQQGKELDTRRCRCVTPRRPPPCGLAPFFCELSGTVLDTKLCRCVAPGGRAPGLTR